MLRSIFRVKALALYIRDRILSGTSLDNERCIEGVLEITWSVSRNRAFRTNVDSTKLVLTRRIFCLSLPGDAYKFS